MTFSIPGSDRLAATPNGLTVLVYGHTFSIPGSDRLAATPAGCLRQLKTSVLSVSPVRIVWLQLHEAPYPYPQ